VTWYCVLDCPGFNALPTLGWHADIPVDKPLRDMKDQYGYTMTDLKDRIKK
jgi:hypothetical protein